MATIKTLSMTCMLILMGMGSLWASSSAFSTLYSYSEPLKPIDSVLRVTPGELAPDFVLPSVSGKQVRLSDFQGEKMVMLTFIPAAWTPVCSDQWPGYNLARPLFERYDTTIIGISVDNIPTLYTWTRQMGDLWFEVVSDFWPHGKTCEDYGVLRSDGTADRAIIIIDKAGVVRYTHVSDINVRPELGMIIKALEQIYSRDSSE
jgi:peroxiredoxin (alkyl hydroperoxide reductase subunit C)